MAGRKQQPGQAGSKGLQAPSSAKEDGQKAGTWFQVGAPAHSTFSAALSGHIAECTEAATLQCYCLQL